MQINIYKDWIIGEWLISINGVSTLAHFTLIIGAIASGVVLVGGIPAVEKGTTFFDNKRVHQSLHYAHLLLITS